MIDAINGERNAALDFLRGRVLCVKGEEYEPTGDVAKAYAW